MRNNTFDYDFKWWQLPNINKTMEETTNNNSGEWHKMRGYKSPTTTWQDEVVEDKDNKWSGGKINPKMMLTKEELRMNVIGQNGNDGLHYNDTDKIDYEKVKTPNYYVGEVFGYEARNIIEDFDLSYNIGTCVSYLLRAKRKHDSQIECIAKAINHLEFELERLKRDEKTNL